MLRAAAALLAAAPVALGHGAMQLPPAWMNPGGAFSKFLQPGWIKYPGAGDQNSAGCTGKAAPGQLERAQGCAAEWYTNYTFINPAAPGSWTGMGKGTPTIPRDSPLRTYQDWDFTNDTGCTAADGPECIDWTVHNPWRAPGTAPVWSPCGVDGGNPGGCPFGTKDPRGCAGGGYAFGPDARTHPFEGVVTTSWTRGSVQSVAWGITANHGGGYAYRLCKYADDAAGNKTAARSALTESCFEQTHLDFVGEESWAVGCANKTSASRAEPCLSPLNVSFTAQRTSTGTHPKGSMWTKNPIPACSGTYVRTRAGLCPVLADWLAVDRSGWWFARRF
jgi:hypothetical protein